MDARHGMHALFWEGLPFLIVFSVFGSIAAINWDYEAKLFVPDQAATGWSEIHRGQILLALAIALTALASIVLLIVRLLNPGITTSPWKFAPLALVALLLIFPSLFLVILGPAAVTMIEQMRTVPESRHQ